MTSTELIEELERELSFPSIEGGEKQIVCSLIARGESFDAIRDICSDSSLRLNLDRVNQILERNYSLQNDPSFIYVPSINIYVAKERTQLGKNWFECHKELQANGERMLILPEFIEFLKYCRINYQDIYKEITEVRNPWRAEWIDADFKTRGRDLFINYNHSLDSSGNLIPQNSELLDKNNLMKDRIPGISLEDYLNSNHTSQGLPTKKVQSGDLYYWYPRSDDNSVAWFLARFDAISGRANLDCGRDPSDRDSVLGVRAVRHA